VLALLPFHPGRVSASASQPSARLRLDSLVTRAAKAMSPIPVKAAYSSASERTGSARADRTGSPRACATGRRARPARIAEHPGGQPVRAAAWGGEAHHAPTLTSCVKARRSRATSRSTRPSSAPTRRLRMPSAPQSPPAPRRACGGGCEDAAARRSCSSGASANHSAVNLVARVVSYDRVGQSARRPGAIHMRPRCGRARPHSGSPPASACPSAVSALDWPR
jgi:hypothetical protein